MRPNLNAIRTLRAGITPPPWRVNEARKIVHTHGAKTTYVLTRDQNLLFISHAPTIIDELLAYIEELEGKVKHVD